MIPRSRISNSKRKRIAATLLIATAMAIAVWQRAEAFNASSTDFYIRSDVGVVVGRSTSTDFDVYNNGQVNVGSFDTSTDFGIFPGIIKAIFEPVIPVYNVLHYHWRNDDGSETSATSATGGAEDTALTGLAASSSIRLRIEIANTGGTIFSFSPQSFQLQYGLLSTTCSAIGSWTAVGAAGAQWTTYNSANLTNGANTTNIAMATGGVADGNHAFMATNGGVRTTTSTTGLLSVPSDSFVEMEYDIDASSSAAGGTYCFRLTNIGSTNHFLYSVYPEATVTGGQSITLTLNPVTLTLPGLSPGNPVSATTTATVNVTGASAGYTLSLKRNAVTSTLASGIMAFPDYASWGPSGTSCASGQGNGTTTPGQTLSFRVQSASTTANYCGFWWGNSDTNGTALYAGVPTSSQIIVNSTSSASQNGTTTTYIVYRADAPSGQEAGSYTGTVTITAIANP